MNLECGEDKLGRVLLLCSYCFGSVRGGDVWVFCWRLRLGINIESTFVLKSCKYTHGGWVGNWALGKIYNSFITFLMVFVFALGV